MPYYDRRTVKAHGDAGAAVMLMNEAPGPCEAHYRIPSVGAQGGNIYRFFKKAEVSWVPEYRSFSWPRMIQEKYKNPKSRDRDFQLRNEFLEIRKKNIICTNAYDHWPKSTETSCDWVDPDSADVLSDKNVNRIQSEVENAKVLLICGEFSWLACFGTEVSNPSTIEATHLNNECLKIVNQRLNARFENAWYMGHTRRWNLKSNNTISALKQIASQAGW